MDEIGASRVLASAQWCVGGVLDGEEGVVVRAILVPKSLSVAAFFAAAICLMGVSCCSACAAETTSRQGRTIRATVPPPADDRGDGPGVSAKLLRYAQRIVAKYDRDGSGRLDHSEWAGKPGLPPAADLDRDGTITVDELAQYLSDYARAPAQRSAERWWQNELPDFLPLLHPATPAESVEAPAPEAASVSGEEPQSISGPTSALPSSRTTGRDRKFHVPAAALPQGLPEWFIARDLDGDGQLTLAEFAPEGTPAQLAEFARYDLNGDGVITAEECLRAGRTGPAGKTGATASPSPTANPATKRAAAPAK